MDFGPVVNQIIQLGLPILGNALGGPLGGAAAGIVAKFLGAPSATPDALKATLDGMDPSVAIQKLKSAEAEWVSTVQSEADVAKTQLSEVGQTMRTELQLIDHVPGRAGAVIAFMQASWRPIFAYETIAEMAGGAIIVAHELWTGDQAAIDMVLRLMPFLQFYMPMKMGVLGVYSWGRTREKQEAIGSNNENEGGLIGRVITAVVNRKPAPAPAKVRSSRADDM